MSQTFTLLLVSVCCIGFQLVSGSCFSVQCFFRSGKSSTSSLAENIGDPNISTLRSFLQLTEEHSRHGSHSDGKGLYHSTSSVANTHD
jgi:hypothetical protein